MNISPIKVLNLNSNSTLKNNNQNYTTKISYKNDSVYFGNAREEFDRKSFEIVKEIFASLKDDSEFRGINRELHIFGKKAQTAAETVNNKLFPLFEKIDVNSIETKNDEFGKTEIIRYLEDPISGNICFDQRVGCASDTLLQSLKINPQKKTVEIDILTEHEHPLEKGAFFNFKTPKLATRVTQYNNARKEVGMETSSYSATGSTSI